MGTSSSSNNYKLYFHPSEDLTFKYWSLNVPGIIDESNSDSTFALYKLSNLSMYHYGVGHPNASDARCNERTLSDKDSQKLIKFYQASELL